MSQCKLLHGVGPAFSSVPRPTGEAECLAWKAHRKDKKMLCMCRRKDPCGLRIYEAAVLPQKKSKLYYNSCLVAKNLPPLSKFMVRCYCMIKMKIFISYNIKNRVAMTKCLSCFIVFFLTSSDIQVYKKNTIPRYRNMKKYHILKPTKNT